MSTPTITSRRLLRAALPSIAVVVALSGPAAKLYADGPSGAQINTGYFGTVAIKGYDPVSYFTDAKAVRGSAEHMVEWLGAVWYFASEEHKLRFAANPVEFAPQYGGYCAIGMAGDTRTNDIDPEAWTIIDGKLYLSYSKEVGNLLNHDTILAADTNWLKFRASAEQPDN